MKQIIRLTETDLHRVIKETVNRILGEAIVPIYNRPNTYDYSYKNKNYMNKGDDMFDEDFIYKAQKVNRICNGKLKVSFDNYNKIITVNTTGTLSLESMDLVRRITKVLGLNRIHLGKGNTIEWHCGENGHSFEKSRKVQFGNKSWDEVPPEHDVIKPPVSHRTYEDEIGDDRSPDEEMYFDTYGYDA